MRPFSPRMFPEIGMVLPLTERIGYAAGVAESFAPVGIGLPCRVRFAADRAGMVAGSETSYADGHVAFPADPGVQKGWRLAVGSRILRMLGAARPRDAAGVLFVAAFELIE